MYLGDLADQSFELFIILGPFLYRRFELAGNVEGDGFACLLPGDKEDGMFRSVVVASAALFPHFRVVVTRVPSIQGPGFAAGGAGFGVWFGAVIGVITVTYYYITEVSRKKTEG